MSGRRAPHGSARSAAHGVEHRTLWEDDSGRIDAGEPPPLDLVLSCSQEDNAAVFARIAGLYLEPGAQVADVTWGQGAFWRFIPRETYRLMATDLATGVDCRSLPYAGESIDAVVFDPPYMHSPGGTAYSSMESFESCYRNNATDGPDQAKYHEAVLALYAAGCREAWRVTRRGGLLIVKCQDEVCCGKQRLTHVEILNDCAGVGYDWEDLFVVMRLNRPGVSRMIRQRHARKNHSYFLVLRKHARAQ